VPGLLKRGSKCFGTGHVDGQARNNGKEINKKNADARALCCPLYFPKAKATRLQAPFPSSSHTLQHLWFCFSFESFACLSWCLFCFPLAVAWAKHTYSPTSVSHMVPPSCSYTQQSLQTFANNRSLYIYSCCPPPILKRRNDGRRRRRGSTALPCLSSSMRVSLPLSHPHVQPSLFEGEHPCIKW